MDTYITSSNTKGVFDLNIPNDYDDNQTAGENILLGQSENMETDITSSNIEGVIDLNIHTENDDNQTYEESTLLAKSADIEGSLIGITRKSLEDMYILYRDHGCAVGFSIRKSTNRFSMEEPDLIVKKRYVCSCEGKKKKKEEELNTNGKKRKSMGETRTGCMAQMEVKLNDDKEYEVVLHDMVHNHPLTRPEMSHLHRSSRKILQPTRNAIAVMHSSGMKPSQSFRYLVEDAGGEEIVGHTMKDHMNLINRWGMLEIEGGDARTLIDKLDERGVEDDQFFYRVRLDENGRLSHIFWRDSMMREDYELFGDVVIFDTTYRTNKYSLICAPFVGLNNHRKNVMYAGAFISDEKIESFEWLFNTFKKSMGGKSPISMFTDQDHAISTAIERAFPETRHRLCLWHLQQNAISRFGELKSNRLFKDTFNKCLSKCVDEEDFEACWKEMTSKYNLKDNSWFNRFYGLRHKWCTALNKDAFSAGILSSQRSEVTNSAINFKANKATNLTVFYGLFNDIVKKWRRKEQEDEFQCTRVNPESVLPMKGILKHASEVYTPINFRIFEDEFKESISHTHAVLPVEDTLVYYKVAPDDGAYRSLLEEYGNHQTRLAKTLFSAMAQHLNFPPSKSESYLSPSTGLLRVYRYLCCPMAEQRWGISAHTDSSVLSILHQDQVGGLQVYKDNKWLDVTPIHDTLIVNIGDMLQAMSDDSYISVTHRVRVNRLKERISIGYFVFPAEDAVIESSKYRPFTYADFQAEKELDLKTVGKKIGLPRFRKEQPRSIWLD